MKPEDVPRLTMTAQAGTVKNLFSDLVNEA